MKIQAGKSVKIFEARTEEDLREVKVLFCEYANLLSERSDPECCEVVEEIPLLPGDYASPDGKLLLASVNDDIAGCVALRKLERGICEMKRLFARSSFRGKGLGRALAVRLLQEAKKLGYSSMRLDTIPPLKEAISLYESLGFKKIDRYNRNPIPEALFMELDLSQLKE